MSDPTAPAAAERKRHHWIVRVTHWVNAVALTLMIASGLRIFNAYPAFARRGERFCCWPWEGHPAPRWATFGGWLAGARNWHFAMMWVLVANGIVYLAFIWLHGEWRDLAPRRGDARDAWEMVKFYLFVRKTHPHQGKHNALQKTVYFALPWLGVLAVLTGLALWKPVQLATLTNLFGGYVWVRYWHFVVMLTLVLLAAGHVFMVFAVDPHSLGAMLTGRYDESKSPEALNARPFLRMRRREPVLGLGRGAAAANLDHSKRGMTEAVPLVAPPVRAAAAAEDPSLAAETSPAQSATERAAPASQEAATAVAARGDVTPSGEERATPRGAEPGDGAARGGSPHRSQEEEG